MTCSSEMIVICDEIIGFVRRLVGGIEITPETLALDVIDEVGPGGEYLSTEHTLQHFKSCWYPRIFDRLSHRGWVEDGRPTALANARQAARDTIASHQPEPLPEATVQALRDLVAAFDDPATPYLSCPRPEAAPRYSDYAQLARVKEWASQLGAGQDGDRR